MATSGPAPAASFLVWHHRGGKSLAGFWLRAVALHQVPLRWWAVVAVLAAGPPLAVAGTSRGLATGEFAVAFTVVCLVAGLAEEPG